MGFGKNIKKDGVNEITDVIDKIKSKEDLIKFINLLAKDNKEHGEEWVNPTIADYLEQVASWIEDYSECPANSIDWNQIDYKTVALMLYMGKIYE